MRFIAVIIFAYFVYSPIVQCQCQSAMSYNIKFDNVSDTLNNWEKRKYEMVKLIDYYSPEVLGTQEALLHQLQYLDENLPQHSWIGNGRDDGKLKGEFCAIFYNHNSVELVTSETFWLSPKSDMPSVGWDASMERICTYALFKNKSTKEQFYVFNAHYDHIGQIAREKSSELILQKIKEINSANLPVILMGDFNAEPDNLAIQKIIRELNYPEKDIPLGIYGPTGTFTGFKKDIIPARRIDYVFLYKMEVEKYRHIDDKSPFNKYISDHLPVFVHIKNKN